MPIAGVLAAAPIAAKIGKSIAGLAGIDTQSPASHIAERSARIGELTQRAIAGDDAAWTSVWLLSSRPLPVGKVDEVPRDEGSSCRPGSCQTSGKTFACKAGCTTNPFHGSPRVGDVAEDALHAIEQARGAPAVGQVSSSQAGMLPGFSTFADGTEAGNVWLGLSLVGAALFFAFKK